MADWALLTSRDHEGEILNLTKIPDVTNFSEVCVLPSPLPFNYPNIELKSRMILILAVLLIAYRPAVFIC